MYSRILVPIDSSESVNTVIVETASISAGWKDCNITLLHVATPVYNASVGIGVVPTAEGVEERIEQEGQLVLEQASRWLRGHNIKPKTVLKWGDPAKEICRYAEEEHMDLIIVGRRDKGRLEKLLLGSVSQKVVQNAQSHVLVVK